MMTLTNIQRMAMTACCAVILWGCSQDGSIIPEQGKIPIIPENAIAFSTSDHWEDENNTARTTIDYVTGVTTFNDGEQIGVYSYYLPGGKEENQKEFMKNQWVTYNEGGTWTYDPLKYWPTAKDDRLSFYAYYPYNSSITDLTAIPFISGTTDYLWMVPFTTSKVDVDRDGDGEVPLNFKHIMTCIQVNMKCDENIEKELTLMTISLKSHKDGAFIYDGTYNATTGEIKSDSSTKEISIKPKTEITKAYRSFYIFLPGYTWGTDEIPYLTFEFSNARTASFYLDNSTHTWEAGKRYVYNLNVEETANSYILNPSSAKVYAINTAHINMFWRRTWTKEGMEAEKGKENPFGKKMLDIDTEWEVDLIWKDNTAITVTFCDAEGKENTEKKYKGENPFYVKTSGGAGNALVGVKRPGSTDYLWSWHLWITDYNPNAKEGESMNGQIHSYGTTPFQPGGSLYGKKMMDRNLGATITGIQDETGIVPQTEEKEEYYGLYYQYGRKDPFRQTGFDAVVVENTGYLTETVKHPKKFYTTTDTNYGLYILPYELDLWAAESSSKSIFDPSPAGWRVPVGGTTKNPWKGFTKENGNIALYKSENDLWGILYTYENVKAWYPASGEIIFTTCKMDGKGRVGYVWHSNYHHSGTGSHSGLVLIYNEGNITDDNNNGFCNGASIRCIQR